MLTNERLKGIIAYLEDIPKTINTTLAKVDAEKLDMARELLSARTRIAELGGDANMLFRILEELTLAYDPEYDQYYCEQCGNTIAHREKIGDNHTKECAVGNVLSRHKALVEKYGKEKK